MTAARTRIYGIANCDTVKKARRWLESRHIDYDFHDYRKDGLDADLLQLLESTLGWEEMLNRRGTTWRMLPDTLKDGIDRASALEIMLNNPAIIKRPILSHDGQLSLGFSESSYAEVLG